MNSNKNYKSIFQFTVQGSELKAVENGDLELELPHRFQFYKNLTLNIASAADEYLSHHHPTIMAKFQGSGMLRPSNIEKNNVYYSVFTTNQNVSDDILKELEALCRKHLASLFVFDKVQQQDLFTDSSQGVDIADIDINCLQDIRDDFIQSDKNTDLKTPITIFSSFGQTPQTVHGMLNKPKVKAVQGDAKPQLVKFQLNSIKRSNRKVSAFYISSYDEKPTSEQLIAEDDTVIKMLFETAQNDYFFVGTVVERGTSDSPKLTKYLTQIEHWEGPKGPLV
ncbi:hypothetical protein [Aliidiomarina quisquiliarum]|uniref:hypothetical protein n=1 Tax=Aliidiomarina quisquiliarum TaxID=2938947 RepID=UPI00208FB062|nr:hypothetical protein [Aliidiomarina quisquiliarum]MCO4320691.1 hypothetical protein [Aliidiomarina quisquiliarum]